MASKRFLDRRLRTSTEPVPFRTGPRCERGGRHTVALTHGSGILSSFDLIKYRECMSQELRRMGK